MSDKESLEEANLARPEKRQEIPIHKSKTKGNAKKQEEIEGQQVQDSIEEVSEGSVEYG